MLKLLILIAGIAFAYFQYGGSTNANTLAGIEKAGKKLSADMKSFRAKAISHSKQFRSVRSKQQYQKIAESYHKMQRSFVKEKFPFQEFDPGSSEEKKAFSKYQKYHKKRLQEAYLVSKSVAASAQKGMGLVIHQPEKIGLTMIGPINLKSFGYEYPD